MAPLSLRPGLRIRIRGRAATVHKLTGFDTLLVQWDDDRLMEEIDRSHIDLPQAKTDRKRMPEAVDPNTLEWANSWLAACKPLLQAERTTNAMYRSVAAELSVHPNTVRRAITRFREGSGHALDLLPPPRAGSRGETRLPPEVEAIVKSVIDKRYLHKRARSMISCHRDIVAACRKAGLVAPHYNTIRLRISVIPRWTKVAARHGSKVADEKMSPIRGSFPNANRPLDVIQIDHYRIDLDVVDSEQRLPAGRPWLTVAIDVYSRMIVGIFLTFAPPSASSTGMCLINAFLRKSQYLAELGVQGAWPVWGKPKILHADNAKEFRGNMLKSALTSHGIEAQFRPVKRPRYGGHIERLIGTVATWLKELPGATFSNPKERGTNGRGGTPALTLRELEQWLVTKIVGDYHVRKHSAINMSPLQKWESYFFGPNGQKEPLPVEIADEWRLRMDMMPAMSRTVQRYGIRIDYIHWMSDAIKHLIPMPGEKAREYLVKYDPRDMSRIWLFDPDIEEYLEVPYRDITRLPAPHWELKLSTREAKKETPHPTEDIIFSTIERLRGIEEDAQSKTKRARRNSERRKEEFARPRMPAKTANPSAEPQASNVVQLQPRRIIKPFAVKIR